MCAISLTAERSPFQVHAVAINQTDICVGNFWVRPAISHLIRRSRPHVHFWQVTTERLLIHPSFTSTVYDDEMLLVVKVTQERNLWDRVIRPFS